MIAHQGENVIIGSVITAMENGFRIDDYNICYVISNVQGREVLRIEGEDIVVGAEQNAIACVIPASQTENMKGLYLVSFEFYLGDEKVHSNEVEQLTIIE